MSPTTGCVYQWPLTSTRFDRATQPAVSKPQTARHPASKLRAPALKAPSPLLRASAPEGPASAAATAVRASVDFGDQRADDLTQSLRDLGVLQRVLTVQGLRRDGEV